MDLKSKLKTYQIKPKVVQAIQYDGTEEMAILIESECCEAFVARNEDGSFSHLVACNNTDYIDNMRTAERGDYLIKTQEVNGEIWYQVVEPELFEHEYEEQKKKNLYVG